jgi:RNA polymerase sigma-70 factor (ECF subfamily)
MPPGEESEHSEPSRDAAFVDLFQSEYPAIVRSMFFIVHDREHARDLAQDAFVQLFTRWRRVSRYERPDAWVRKVAVRMAVRSIKRERLRRQLEHEVDVLPERGGVDLDVLRAIAKLPASQRAAIVLFYLEDRPVAEVADIMSCSEVTAKVHLHRARRRLAELLGDDESREDAIHAS